MTWTQSLARRGVSAQAQALAALVAMSCARATGSLHPVRCRSRSRPQSVSMS